MAFGPVWPRSAVVESSIIAVQKAAKSFQPEGEILTARPVHRLKKRSEFLRVARDGRKAATRSLVLQSLETELGAGLRSGFTATKKIGNAVARNRTKRRLREALRLTIAGTAYRKTDIVVIGRAATRQLPFSQILHDMRDALRKLDVLPELR